MSFNPVLITTPRSGSTVICKLMGNIARQTSDYKNNLMEFFNIDPICEVTYGEPIVFGEKTIAMMGYKFFEKQKVPWYGHDTNIALMQNHLCDMLENNKHKYMMKIFSHNFANPRVNKLIRSQYDCVFLERRDKLAQLLSMMAVDTTRTPHYQDDSTPVSGFYFQYHLFKFFKERLKLYNHYASSISGPIIFYEDFIQMGSNQQALEKLLGIESSSLTPIPLRSIPTPYTDSNIENLILNKDEWLKYKDEVISFLTPYTIDTHD